MGTVTKALSLLGVFTQNRVEIGLTELAGLAGLNKATALRLLRELESAGLVEQLPASRAYRLGPGVLRLAALREAAVPIRRIAEPILTELAAETGETAHLGLMQGERLVPYAHVYSHVHATRVMMDDIDVLDFHATGSGLAVLAFSPQSFVERILARPLPAYTPATLTDPVAVRGVLDRVRAAGVAQSAGGVEVDVHSVSAPFFDAQGRPAGAVTVAAPISRRSDETTARLVDAVRAAGAALTRDLGGIAPAHYPARAA